MDTSDGRFDLPVQEGVRDEAELPVTISNPVDLEPRNPSDRELEP